MAINTLPGNLKMWMDTAFRGFKNSHYALRYMAEFQYRFNRRFDLAKLTPRLLLHRVEARMRLCPIVADRN